MKSTGKGYWWIQVKEIFKSKSVICLATCLDKAECSPGRHHQIPISHWVGRALPSPAIDLDGHHHTSTPRSPAGPRAPAWSPCLCTGACSSGLFGMRPDTGDLMIKDILYEKSRILRNVFAIYQIKISSARYTKTSNTWGKNAIIVQDLQIFSLRETKSSGRTGIH